MIVISLVITSDWAWDPASGSRQVTALIKKDFGFATETPLDDVIYTVSSDTSWWGGSK